MSERDVLTKYSDILGDTPDTRTVRIAEILDATRATKPNGLTDSIRSALLARMAEPGSASQTEAGYPGAQNQRVSAHASSTATRQRSIFRSALAFAAVLLLVAGISWAAVSALVHQRDMRTASGIATRTASPTRHLQGVTGAAEAVISTTTQRATTPASTPASSHVVTRLGTNLPPLHGVYVMNSGATKLLPADAQSMAVDRSRPTVDLVPPNNDRNGANSDAMSVFVSNDGGTMAVTGIYGPRVRIYNTATGKLRSSIKLPYHGFWNSISLSRDGNKLVELYYTDNTHATWAIFDTQTGRKLNSFNLDPFHSAILSSQVSPSGDYVYLLLARYTTETFVTGPKVPILVKYDIRTGLQAGSLQLHGLVAGSWRTDRRVNGARVAEDWRPAFALSPNGHTLAIVHANKSQITFLDADDMRVEHSVTLTHPKSLLQTLGLVSLDADAKGNAEGADQYAQYSRDGKTLYLWSDTTRLNSKGRPSYTNSGLEAVDPATGEVKATALKGDQIVDLQESQDGRSLYVRVWPNGPNPGAYLVTLDSANLRTLAASNRYGAQVFVFP